MAALLPNFGPLGWREVIANARRAKAQTGRGLAAQLIAMLSLRLGPQRIQTDEYFDLRLFDPAMTKAARAEYIGRWTFDRVYRVQEPGDTAIADDKLASYRLFEERGLAYPRLHALYGGERDFPGAAHLHSLRDVRDWLAGAPFPLFAKPVFGNKGFGASAIDAMEGDTLRLGDGRTIPLAELLARHDAIGRGALMFQEKITPHPDLAAHIGNRTATARIVVLNDREEPELFRGSLRIPAGRNMTDNFSGGKRGNLIAPIDLRTGRLLHVLTAVGLDYATTERHPDTGAMLAGYPLPDWDAAVKLLQAGSRAMRGMKIHAWDIAFSDRGPLLVEANARGDYPQHANAKGFADARLRELYPGGKI